MTWRSCHCLQEVVLSIGKQSMLAVQSSLPVQVPPFLRLTRSSPQLRCSSSLSSKKLSSVNLPPVVHWKAVNAVIAACAGTTIPEVDSVLTTAEVQQLIEQQGAEFRQLSTIPVDSLMPISSSSSSCSDDGQLYGVPGGSGELMTLNKNNYLQVCQPMLGTYQTCRILVLNANMYSQSRHSVAPEGCARTGRVP